MKAERGLIAAFNLILLFFFYTAVSRSADQRILLIVVAVAQIGIQLFSSPVEQIKSSLFLMRSMTFSLLLMFLVTAENKEALLLLTAAGSLFLNLNSEILSEQWRGSVLKNSALTITVLFFFLVSISFLPILGIKQALSMELAAFLMLGLEDFFVFSRKRNYFTSGRRVLFYGVALSTYLKAYFAREMMDVEIKIFFSGVISALFILLMLQFVFQKNTEKKQSIFMSIWNLFMFWTMLFVQVERSFLLIPLFVFASWVFVVFYREPKNLLEGAMSFAAPGTILFFPLISVLTSIKSPFQNYLIWMWIFGFIIIWFSVSQADEVKKIEKLTLKEGLLLAINVASFFIPWGIIFDLGRLGQ